MSSRGYFSVLLHAFVFATVATLGFSQLSPNYYDYSCPNALSTIKSVVEAAVQKENRMGASLLRLHFHDCWVNVRLCMNAFICIYVIQNKYMYAYVYIRLLQFDSISFSFCYEYYPKMSFL